MNESSKQTLLKEFRRGTLIIAVLAGLQTERYPAELIGFIADHGMPLQEVTVYPMLRRLAEQGLLESRWSTDSNRPRRYYKLSAQGRTLLKQMLPLWRTINASVEAIYKEASRP